MPHDLTLTGIDWTVDDRPHHQDKHDRFAADMDYALQQIADRQPKECEICRGHGWLMATDPHAPWREHKSQCWECS